MGDVHRLPLRQLVLVDERGAGLRATWHEERELVVLSIWRDDSCVATFRLPIADVAGLAAFLSTVSAEWAAAVVAGRRPGPAEPMTLTGDNRR
jgi:hypothetical protein